MGIDFPREVIVVAERWLLCYGLSYRVVKELLAERGVEVDHVTLCPWAYAAVDRRRARADRHAARTFRETCLSLALVGPFDDLVRFEGVPGGLTPAGDQSVTRGRFDLRQIQKLPEELSGLRGVDPVVVLVRVALAVSAGRDGDDSLRRVVDLGRAGVAEAQTRAGADSVVLLKFHEGLAESCEGRAQQGRLCAIHGRHVHDRSLVPIRRHMDHAVRPARSGDRRLIEPRNRRVMGEAGEPARLQISAASYRQHDGQREVGLGTPCSISLSIWIGCRPGRRDARATG